MENSLKVNGIGLKLMSDKMGELINSKQILIDEAKRSLSAQQFADEILRLREAAGLSQKQLAAIIKIDKAVISRVENANHGVSLDLVLLLAIAFGQDPHRLADVYWGTQSESYDEQSRFTLSQIRDIIARFYNLPLTTTQELPPHNPMYTSPELEAKIPQSDQLAREESLRRQQEKEKDQPESPDQGQGQDTTTENISQEPHTEKED